MKHKLIFNIGAFVLLISFLITCKPSFSQNNIPDDFCISKDEYKLYNLINDYRKAMKLPNIPLSKSLSFVATQHISDLVKNVPDTNTCNFHSWSDKGKWTACCFEKEIKDRSCMQEKPKEITDYPGVAFEIVYWENRDASADNAFDQWRETTAARALITNFKDWEDYSWNAMGIGIKEGFAIAWFGQETDVEKETKICGTNTVVVNEPTPKDTEPEVISSPTERFYIIIGSYSSLEESKKLAKDYIDEGFKKAKILSKDDKFRISLADYKTKELATEGKKELPEKYKDAWIMEF